MRAIKKTAKCRPLNADIIPQNRYKFKKKTPVWAVVLMGRMTGLEPATFGTTNQRSNQLSYIRHTVGLMTK